jgi:hypothetical protein
MSYRYNSMDIVVGVGLCAIVFGALLMFLAASGMFIAGTQASAIDRSFPSTESGWLQPAMGQAIVERAMLQQQTDRVTASAISEWSRAVEAQRNLQPTVDHPLSAVLARAVAVPNEHDARVQAVMGRAIVNFTQRGIRSGVLSADLYLSDYNHGMISATENRGKRMHEDFASSWQSLLGSWIVDASRMHLSRTAEVQAQLGTAILHVTLARTVLEDAWAVNQSQVGTLLAALDRTGGLSFGGTPMASAASPPETMAAFGAIPVIPDISMTSLIGAALLMCTIFFAGVVLSAAGRESKALAEARRNAGRWVYRMAS